MDRLIGIAVPDERPLAGRIVGWMYVVGAIVTTLLPVLPGAHGQVITPTLPIAVGCFIWGVAALRRVDWVRAPGWVIHLSAFGGSLCAAVATHDTGELNCPNRRITLILDLAAGYARLRSQGGWLFRFFTEGWPPHIHEKLTNRPVNGAPGGLSAPEGARGRTRAVPTPA